MEIIVSVIVTIHNAEKYLKECLNSVLSQTLPQIEILCIDGGSVDATPQILRDYASRDARIRIINDANTSYGHKVNRGIEEARGEYISVLESDDMYKPFMLERLYGIAEQYHVDFVNADYESFYDVNGQRFCSTVKMYSEENYNCVINYKEHPERFGIIPRYWTGLFRKEYLEREGIKMNESLGASYQDMSFRFLTSILAQSAYHLDIPIYLYRIDNPDSSMHDSTKTIVIADEHDFLKKELLKRQITDSYIWYNAYQWKYTDFRGNMRGLKGSYRKELFRRYREELEKDRDSLAAYSGFGYSKLVSEMIMESPEVLWEMIEEEAAIRITEWKKVHRFLDRMTRLDEGQKIVVFGCGKVGQAVLKLIKFAENRICCMTDNSKLLWDTVKYNHKVLSPENAIKQYPDAFFIVANKFNAKDIAQQLYSNGIREDMVCIYGKEE